MGLKYRFDIINYLIDIHGYSSYLEIGTDNKNACFNKIKCKEKVCVDPAKNDQNYTFNINSDDFFLINKAFFDIIFIDGLHTSEQSFKDIINALSFLNDGGSIVVHDTNPPTEFHATDYNSNRSPAYPAWNGTVWKSIYRLRKTRDDLIIRTYNTDYGVTVIQKGRSELLILDNEFYSFRIFDANRKEILNII